LVNKSVENYTIQVKDGWQGIECNWIAAIWEIDAKAWTVDGILFKDVVRHNGFQNLLRDKDETSNENVNSYLWVLEIAKMPKDDPMDFSWSR
jgi:hypothetical protein